MVKTRAFLIFGISLIVLSIWQINSAKGNILVSQIEKDGVPATIYVPLMASDDIHPVVLVAHGIAASQNIMSSFALSLSHAGYSVITWDFNGHGSNANPFTSENYSNTLVDNATTALSIASDMGFISDSNHAILGHSMGSGVALNFGQSIPETKATIAVSPVRQTVTPELPKNLLLLAGSREGNFVRNAEVLLIQAGGAGGDPNQGNARKIHIVPNVEHISILFSKEAYSEARTWLEATFGTPPNAKEYSENRHIWYSIGILGFVIVSYYLPKNSLLDIPSNDGGRSLWIKLILILTGTLGGTFILWLIDRIGIELLYSFNLLIGGYLILWFGICGVLCLLIMRINPGLPRINQIVAGFIGFILIWFGVGLLGRSIWLEWLLIPKRLLLWPLGATLLLPWFLMIGELIKKSNLIGLIGWWLVNSLIIIIGMLLSISLLPSTGFLILIIPIVPILLALHMLFTIPWGHGWVFGISGSMFISWTLFAVFPIV
jgi:pimeloyl-ACP methyl ester carboxylesterase